jgi:hypothetical protein
MRNKTQLYSNALKAKQLSLKMSQIHDGCLKLQGVASFAKSLRRKHDVLRSDNVL